jgi:phenylalanyl-tRNA synthetase beta chain
MMRGHRYPTHRRQSVHRSGASFDSRALSHTVALPMKISLEWLSEFLPGIGSGAAVAEAAGEALTHGGLPVESIETSGNDQVLDVEVTSNRADCLSHRGVARELAALLDQSFTDQPPTAVESAAKANSALQVRIYTPALCPHYTARVIRGVKIGPSPAWLVRRLEAVGQRSVNNVVDITNYVMFELGQPLHAFDLDRLSGGEIIVRTAAAGESIISIDGHERKLTSDMLVIADAKRPVALAGVIGGRDSEVTDGTVNLLLESARFDPLSVRKTARQLALKSESSYRYERGIDPLLPVYAGLRAAHLIVEIAGGTAVGDVMQAGYDGRIHVSLVLRRSKLRSVLGVDLDPAEVTAALTRLGFDPREQAGGWIVSVPSYRLDVNLEIDLVEEVARLIGYDRIPVRDEISIRLTPPDLSKRTLDHIRHHLAASGYSEAVTFSFVSDALAKDFIPAEAASLPRADASVRKADAYLRPSLLPALVEAIGRNESAGVPGACLFEIGSVFWNDQAKNLVETRHLGLAGGELRQVRGTIDSLLARLEPSWKCEVIPSPCPGLSSSGKIEWNGQLIGWIGLVNKSVSDKLGLRQVPAAAELELAALLRGARHVPQLRPLPRFPAVRRDLSLVIPEKTRYAALEKSIAELHLSHLEEMEYVTTYRGKPLEKGSKSVTITLIFRSAKGTLTSEEVDGSVNRVIQAVRESLGATLRV